MLYRHPGKVMIRSMERRGFRGRVEPVATHRPQFYDFREHFIAL